MYAIRSYYANIRSTYDIPQQLEAIEDAVLSKEPRKSSDLFDLIDEKSGESLEIQQEKEKLSQLKQKHEHVQIQREELAQLIEYRQKYEQKIVITSYSIHYTKLYDVVS